MKCGGCGTTFYIGGGTGSSDAPGVFLAGAALGGVAYLAGLGLELAFPTLGAFVKWGGALFGVASLLLTQTAISDATAYGPRHCPKCDNEVPVRIWSL